MMEENKSTMAETNKKPVTVNQSVAETEEEIDLLELGYMLWKHIVQIVLCLVIGGAAAFAYTMLLVTKQYTATADMYIVGSQNSVIDMSALQIGTQITADYQEMITSEDLLDSVIENLKLDTTYDKLAAKITMTNPSGTRILKISATDSDPQMAADIANEVAKQSKVKLPEYTKGTAPEIYNKAKVPTKASSPSTSKNTLLGALLVTVIYCGYLVVTFLMNDTFVTSDDIYKTFGVQPIAVVPKFGKKRKRKNTANNNKKKGKKR